MGRLGPTVKRLLAFKSLGPSVESQTPNAPNTAEPLNSAFQPQIQLDPKYVLLAGLVSLTLNTKANLSGNTIIPKTRNKRLETHGVFSPRCIASFTPSSSSAQSATSRQSSYLGCRLGHLQNHNLDRLC